MLDHQQQRRLDDLFDAMKAANESFLGYPFAKGFSYESLWRFMNFSGNNVGDPFGPETYRVSSRLLECEVVEFFAGLFRAPPSETWGYVTNGGTEGNTYGLYLGRELYPNAVAYFSRDTHYSVSKAIRLLRLEHVVVRAEPSGEIAYEDLAQQAIRSRQRPAIVVANIGTTMKEGKDDIKKIRQALHDVGVEEVYIHSDAALCGPYAPFQTPRTPFDFLDGADSIMLSGHKFFGAPIPCGVVLARKQHVQRVLQTANYIGSSDTTLSGSRSAYTPVILWYAIRSLGIEGIKRMFEQCVGLAAYTVDELKARGMSAWRNPSALTVVLPPVEEYVRIKWQIVTQDVSHLVITPGTTKAQIDALVESMTIDNRRLDGHIL
ncbi:histidine decarboxylase [Bradyrhizobium diazoefficiens]|uniref:histidine decarboxylase n=1 Tax=Bradyrhizobium diazoefficiens TaxID=1355477 RepID=UPI00190B7FEE|nr:histidine decarboxylase [Bradyrhizobium diazoefficiens]MBK3666343.1 histidine decarboxylase [Bradyrhizobium diazoefficiens]